MYVRRLPDNVENKLHVGSHLQLAPGKEAVVAQITSPPPPKCDTAIYIVERLKRGVKSVDFAEQGCDRYPVVL